MFFVCSRTQKQKLCLPFEETFESTQWRQNSRFPSRSLNGDKNFACHLKEHLKAHSGDKTHGCHRDLWRWREFCSPPLLACLAPWSMRSLPHADIDNYDNYGEEDDNDDHDDDKKDNDVDKTHRSRTVLNLPLQLWLPGSKLHHLGCQSSFFFARTPSLS